MLVARGFLIGCRVSEVLAFLLISCWRDGAGEADAFFIRRVRFRGVGPLVESESDSDVSGTAFRYGC